MASDLSPAAQANLDQRAAHAERVIKALTDLAAELLPHVEPNRAAELIALELEGSDLHDRFFLTAAVGYLTVALVDERAAHAKTFDNFEVFAESAVAGAAGEGVGHAAERAAVAEEIAQAIHDRFDHLRPEYHEAMIVTAKWCEDEARRRATSPGPAGMVEAPAITGLMNYVGVEGTAYVPAPAGDSAADTSEPEHRCPRCGSPRWVSVSLDEGWTRIAQCVPCGAFGDKLGPGWRAELAAQRAANATAADAGGDGRA